MEAVAQSQAHLLTFQDSLSPSEKSTLNSSISSVNIPECEDFFNRVLGPTAKPAEINQGDLQPISRARTNSDAAEDDRLKWQQLGSDQISSGKVGVLLLAGGQGSRLGSPLPKGCLSIGSASGKSLFQIQVERILRRENLAKENKKSSPNSSNPEQVEINLYIMTSPATFANTKNFFDENKNFGLKSSQIKIFNQGLLPCFNFEGKIMLKDKCSIAMAPDGNGGLWKALRVNKILDDMEAKNLESIHMYCVDNVLTKVANPEFIGFCLDKKADCAASCVEKTNPHESVGVVCSYKNKAKVIEYSEISKDHAEAPCQEDSSKLAFRAGNICNHYFTVDFIKKVTSPEWEDKLEHHVAKKKIQTIDLQSGEEIKPEANNGIKLEKFVFDVFQFSDNFALFSRNRAEEFSPLKNNEKAKSDNARTARSHLHKLHHKLVLENGGRFSDENANQLDGNCDFSENEYKFRVEISPLTSYSGEGLERVCRGKTFELPLNL